MAKSENLGCFTLRPPRGAAGRAEFFVLVDLLNAAIEENTRLQQGPRTKTTFVLELLKERFADELARRQRNEARLEEESPLEKLFA